MREAPTIVIDIETRADDMWLSHPDSLEMYQQSIRVPGNYKSPTKIAEYKRAKIAERQDKAALHPGDGAILAVGWRRSNDNKAHVIMRETEIDTLTEMCNMLRCWEEDYRLAGYHVRTFDIPFVTIRCARHRLRLPGWWPDPRDRRRVRDAADVLTSNNLQYWLAVMKIPRKLGDGADVANMTSDELREYCLRDVESTYQLCDLLGMVS